MRKAILTMAALAMLFGAGEALAKRADYSGRTDVRESRPAQTMRERREPRTDQRAFDREKATRCKAMRGACGER